MNSKKLIFNITILLSGILKIFNGVQQITVDSLFYVSTN